MDMTSGTVLVKGFGFKQIGHIYENVSETNWNSCSMCEHLSLDAHWCDRFIGR